MALVIGLIWTGISGTIGGIAVRFVVGLKSSVSTAMWTNIGALKDLATGTPIKRDVVIQQNSGWGRFNSLRSVWIVKRDRQTTVFSATCPHLGCTIDASASGFACPCHGSSWSATGERLGGPAPRNLDVLESRVDGNTLKIRYQDFKQGSTEKESV